MRPLDASTFDSKIGEEIIKGLATSPYLPYREHPGADASKIAEYLISESRRILVEQEGRAHALMADRDGEPEGMAVFEYLDWHSEVLEYPAGEIYVLEAFGNTTSPTSEINSDLLGDILAECQARGIKHVTLWVDTRNREAVIAAINRRMMLISTLVIYSYYREDRVGVLPKPEHPIREVEKKDVEELEKFADKFVYSRFGLDPNVPTDKAESLYAGIIKKACYAESDALLVAELEGEVAGFMSYTIKRKLADYIGLRIGKIGIGATSPSYRKRGIFRSLLSEIIERLEAEVDVLEIAPHVMNIPAFRTCQRLGMMPTSSHYVFHGYL
jgi:GNAT superfamily N-acetyltransferase